METYDTTADTSIDAATVKTMTPLVEVSMSIVVLADTAASFQ
jgi:hypothetical protein